MSRMIRNISKRFRLGSKKREQTENPELFVLPERQMLAREEHLKYIHNVDSTSLQIPSSDCNGQPHQHQPQNTEEDQAWLKWIESRTGSMSKVVEIDLPLFKKILEIEHAFYAERLFAIFDPQSRGYITASELLGHLSRLTNACACQKLKLIYDMYDVDGNGTIDEQEFMAVLSSAIDDNALAIGPQQIEYMTKALFEAVDANKDGVLTFGELKLALEKSPEWISTLKISASRFLRPPVVKSVPINNKKQKNICHCPPYFLTKSYIQRHPVEFWWSVIYIISLIAFYLYGSLYAVYVNHVISTEACLHWYAIAHGFGMNLNWNCMLLVLFMLRRTLTLLRNTRIGPYLPFDLAVFIHKIVGLVVGICTLGHFIMHMFHFKCLADTPRVNHSYTELLFTAIPGLGWVPPGIVSITGWAILFAYIVIFVCSLSFVRRSGMFEIFFFTHLLYIPFMIILIIHSDKFWKFLVVPGTIFILEKISMTRCVRQMLGSGFHIKEVTLWASGVTQLTFNHPPGFNFNPGDYVFVNIPNIAWFEWHPFTISSCPENRDAITLHVRCLGEWTKRLHTYFKNHNRNCGGVVVDGPQIGLKFTQGFQQPSIFYKKRQSVKGQPVRALHIPIYIDGPYGTPSGKIFQAEHAVLICAGIGVTPFASILQSIMYRHRVDRIKCPECAHEWAPHLAIGQKSHLKKVNFIWVVNNQRSIEWFVELLEQLDMEQLKENELDRLIDIHIYVTSATKMGDLYAFALTTALDVFYEKHSRDMITGIRSRAIPGRPNWANIFDNINENKRGRVSVFFCGPPVLATELWNKCTEYDFEFSKESF